MTLRHLFYCANCCKYHPLAQLGETKKTYKKCKQCVEKSKSAMGTRSPV